MKRFWKHGSTVLLIAIIAILIVPSWRVSFQGWFQGLFMGDTYFQESSKIPLPSEIVEWEFYDTSNQKHALKDFYDRPIVLSFWATWCGPCRIELAEIKELKKQLATEIHFISVSEESIEKIKSSGLDQDYDFLFGNSVYPQFFEISAYPTLCIIDNQGNLIFKQKGAAELNNEKNISFLKGLAENE